jgi:hypothetical protein
MNIVTAWGADLNRSRGKIAAVMPFEQALLFC